MEGNTEKLEELCKLVRDVEDFILQPLRRLGGSTPPEIVDSLAQLESYALLNSVCNSHSDTLFVHSDLASQRDRIVLLQKQKGSLKALLAADIVGEISATETRLRGAINLFNVCNFLIIHGMKSHILPRRLLRQPQIYKTLLEGELMAGFFLSLLVLLLIPVFRCVFEIVWICGQRQIYERKEGAVSSVHEIGHPVRHPTATRPSRKPICSVARLPRDRKDGNSKEHRPPS